MVSDDKRGPFSWVRRFVKKNSAGGTIDPGTAGPHPHHGGTHNGGGSKERAAASAATGRNDSLDATQQQPVYADAHHNDVSEKQHVPSDTHEHEHDDEEAREHPSAMAESEPPGSASGLEGDRPVTPSSNTRLSRVQIIDTQPDGESPRPSKPESTSTDDTSPKFRSNSTFTVPSVARTSMTTVSPSPSSNASTATAPLTSLAPVAFQQLHHGDGSASASASGRNIDTASVITIASSSKWHSRRSFDTNASTMALAPESILSRTESMDSASMVGGSGTAAKSVTSSNRLFDSDQDQEAHTGP